MLLNYNPQIVYQPGSENAVDILLCKPVPADTPRDPVEDYINCITVDSLPPAISIQELLLAAESDPTLQVVREYLNIRNWENAPKSFQLLKEELCQKQSLVLRNSRIVVPEVMHPRILQLAHEGQKGITKVKQHLRQRVCWYGFAGREICT